VTFETVRANLDRRFAADRRDGEWFSASAAIRDSTRRLAQQHRSRRRQETAMRALLYTGFATIGGLLSVAIGYLVEPKVSMTVSLIVFLVLFFANFIVSWIAVIFVMNALLGDVQRRRAPSDMERAGREAMTARWTPQAR